MKFVFLAPCDWENSYWIPSLRCSTASHVWKSEVLTTPARLPVPFLSSQSEQPSPPPICTSSSASEPLTCSESLAPLTPPIEDAVTTVAVCEVAGAVAGAVAGVVVGLTPPCATPTPLVAVIGVVAVDVADAETEWLGCAEEVAAADFVDVVRTLLVVVAPSCAPVCAEDVDGTSTYAITPPTASRATIGRTRSRLRRLGVGCPVSASSRVGGWVGSSSGGGSVSSLPTGVAANARRASIRSATASGHAGSPAGMCIRASSSSAAAVGRASACSAKQDSMIPARSASTARMASTSGTTPGVRPEAA